MLRHVAKHYPALLTAALPHTVVKLAKTPSMLHCLAPLMIFLHAGNFCTANQSSLQKLFSDSLKKKAIVGAQLIEGSTRGSPAPTSNYGFDSPNQQNPVTQNTKFCIGSCSKPLVACLLFILIDREILELNEPADQWLPCLGRLELENGTPVRSPSVQELLTHRGGIYSQKHRLTRAQLKPIRDFTLSLSEASLQICDFPLLAKPGERYAYSGAGYCLLGRIAEKATNQSIEALLQKYLCKPLGMRSTTYFPTQTKSPVATGGIKGTRAPHQYGDELRLPLVGGSIHTTASDLQRFVRMVANGGTIGSSRLMRQPRWQAYLSLPYHDQNYGNGWTHQLTGEQKILTHNGSLPPSQSTIRLNLSTGEYTIATWTLADPSDHKTTSRLRMQIKQAMDKKESPTAH